MFRHLGNIKKQFIGKKKKRRERISDCEEKYLS